MAVHSAPPSALVGGMRTSPSRLTIHELVSAIRSERGGDPIPVWVPSLSSDGSLVVHVRASHPGAGASSVAVALTDVLVRRAERDATLVDLARGVAFGASEATEVRADLGLRGWTGGRRGRARIVRLAPNGAPESLDGDVVIDSCDSRFGPGQVVVVCRPTVLSVRRTDFHVTPTKQSFVAVVGASKWPSAVRSSLGPQLARATAAGRVVFFPRDAELEINGLSAHPLPTSTMRAAGRLVDLLREVQATQACSDSTEERA